MVTGASVVGNGLTLFASGGALLGTIALGGDVMKGGHFAPDGTTGGVTMIACFVSGTRLALGDGGKVGVEALRAGDRVKTILGGDEAEVVWIGHRMVDCRRHPRPGHVWPVRIVADAFRPGQPCRDLWLSPDHAIYVNDVLIPVRHLANGSTIAQVPVDDVTYYHVELPAHDVVLAEGLPVESYLETGGRANFANGASVARQFPDFSGPSLSTAMLWETRGCARLVITGKELEVARAQLDRRAAEMENAKLEAAVCVAGVQSAV